VNRGVGGLLGDGKITSPKFDGRKVQRLTGGGGERKMKGDYQGSRKWKEVGTWWKGSRT